MKPVDFAHCNLEFPLFCHPSDGTLVKIVTLQCQSDEQIRSPRIAKALASSAIRPAFQFWRSERSTNAAMERSDRTENSELHIQTSELSVFRDWGAKEGVAHGMS